ncbi:MAG: OmpA family protein [Bacteroidales bacterium]|nr:OmpA family protein [Bacteroidales bacterium]
MFTRVTAFLTLIATILLLAGGSVDSYGQKKKKDFKYKSTNNKKAFNDYNQGKTLFMEGRHEAALDMFKSALDKDPEYLDALYGCAEVYRELKQPGNQFNMIAKAVGIDSTYYVSSYHAAAVALCQKERFREALEWFDKFDRFSKGKKLQITEKGNWRAMARAKVELMEHPVPFNPEYPSDQIRDMDYETYWPSLTLDERELVVTTRLPRDTVAYHKDPTMIARINNNETQEDFYVMRRMEDDAPWTALNPIRSLNTDFNEGAQALSPDGRWMFYTACGLSDSKGSCDIYFSQRTEKGWTKGINIGTPVNSRDWESQPCFSADGKTLFFVRGSSKSQYRNGDIYYAQVVGVNANGIPTFSAPVKMSGNINTPGDESHPFIHHDGKTLYFSSDTWPGVGGKDIFISRLQDDGTWSRAKNIGYPINTVGDDEGLVVTANGTTGYYNSTRDINGRIKREVKKFELYKEIRPAAVPFVRGMIYDCKTKKTLPNDVLIALDKMPDGKNIVTSRAMPDGTFMSALPEIADYLLSIRSKGYFFRSHRFSVADVEKLHGPIELKQDEVCLNKLVPGEKIALRNIYFDTDKWDIKPESQVELAVVIQTMKENPDIRVEISGHTDSRASVKHNQVLSENRAKATVDYLVAHGIARERFVAVGYGLTQPCATNETEEGRALNRRIEAKIIK